MIPIAIYHWNIGIVSRGKGKSAVAAAAYRSGEKLTNEWDGMTHDYTRKGGVVHTEIILPPHAPPSFADRSTLWNSVELYEKAGNAQLAREIDAALPIELSREEQIRLVREYCSSQFVSRGMCVDFAIHDTDSGNPHCHIMLTMRPLDERGAWAAKSKKKYDLDENGERIRLPSGRYKTHKVDLTGWNSQENALVWRKAWADISNDYLERAGSPERIDHRSNAERGIDEIPTVHMGVAACQMEKKCKAIYDKNAETILGNMDSVLFLGGRESSTIKEISENWLGKATISMQTEGRSRGQSESYSQNTQRLGRELMTPSELATMPGDRCILQLRGLPPFYSKKYDLKQHPNYRFTAEADKVKNAFDLDRLIDRRRRPGMNEECEVYEVSVPDEALTDEDEDILNYDDLDDPDAFV